MAATACPTWRARNVARPLVFLSSLPIGRVIPNRKHRDARFTTKSIRRCCERDECNDVDLMARGSIITATSVVSRLVRTGIIMLPTSATGQRASHSFTGMYVLKKTFN